MREQKLIDEYYSDYRALGIRRLRELHRTGQLEQTMAFFDRMNRISRAAGATEAGFHNAESGIDIQRCIEDQNYK